MSDCPLKQTIIDAMKSAMRNQEKARLGTIRLIQAALKQKEVDERVELTDQDVLTILDKMVKQRKESIKQYTAADRQELADQEATEIEVIQTFLPAQLSAAEVDTMIAEAMAQTGATSMQDTGKVMGVLKPQLQGRADMGAVSQKIKHALSA